ncbi:MAG TPA: lipid-A-disaccharide synthase [Casimicrobiaceae bacterium]|nr:lipid-A-disaccharide synthase [Casimicrobiaceae bacterium]
MSKRSGASDGRPSRAITIGIVAGEASGDALAAVVINAVRERVPQVRFVGIAGPRMQAAGCESWHSIEVLSVRGLVEVIGRLRGLLALRRDLVRRMRRERVHLFIGVDAPDFNLGLERRLKRARIRTLHLVSPSVWAWRRERVPKIARSVDRLLALFPFEPAIYEGSGLPVSFIGHPLAEHAADATSRREARERLRLPRSQAVVALLPGSRVGELEMHADLLLDTAKLLHAERPDMHFVVPLGTRATRDRFELALAEREHALPVTVLYGHATDALQAADVALVASGTATLEAALARCPHVIFYRVHSFTARMLRKRLLLPWVGLPNVLAGRFVVPELLQENATPENLAQALLNLYDDAVIRPRIETLFAALGKALKQDTGSLAADAVVQELGRAGVPC